MKRALTTIAAALAVAAATTTGAAGPADKAAVAAAAARFGGVPGNHFVERGRYVVRTAGCNDCHTAHYPEKAGDVPERDWLTGVPVGFQGPWGTTYPTNLRLLAGRMTEQQWMTRARQAMRPPMPWFALRDMTDDDVRAIYAYLRSLGPAGIDAPAYVAPGGMVTTPYIVFVPQNLPPKQAQAR